MGVKAVYIVTSNSKKPLYTGVTGDLAKRIYQHKNPNIDGQRIKGFSPKYNCQTLLYYEIHDNMDAAIAREDQIKDGSRAKKVAMMDAMNPEWKDLYYNFLGISEKEYFKN
jgi:predicted GIY-YIG superfamily endonuclease